MIDFDDVRANAVGRWVDIFRSLGIEIREDGRHGPCPGCGGKDRMRFDDKAGKGTYFCNGCGAGDGFSLVQKVLNYDIKDAMEAVSKVVGSCSKNSVATEKKISREVFREMFSKSVPATTVNLVGKYLLKRGLKTIPTVLRCSDKCWESETKRNQNAMLAVVILPDGTASTMHRTYLSSNAEKLDIISPKKLMPVLVKKSGGAVRLFDVEENGILGVSEGIETAIAAYEDIGIPVWSAISTAGMEAFEPPKEVKHVVVIADNDLNYAGQKAAYSLAHKLSIINKIKVSVYVPKKQGYDWLDQYNEETNKSKASKHP